MTIALLGKGLDRKTRFLVGFLLLICLFALPIVIAITVQAIWFLALFVGAFLVCVYMLYRMTIKNIKLKYPLVSPEGHPDVYTGRMPRPIYEDMEKYPWFFRKKHAKERRRKKEVKKKP